MKRLLLLALLPLAGCASSGVPVAAACLSCQLLQASGVCGSTMRVAQDACPEGEEQWVLNYVDVVERGAAPVLGCHKRKAGEGPQ